MIFNHPKKKIMPNYVRVVMVKHTYNEVGRMLNGRAILVDILNFFPNHGNNLSCPLEYIKDNCWLTSLNQTRLIADGRLTILKLKKLDKNLLPH